MDFVEFQSLAQRLLADDPSEAAIRSAISRSYYAAFHACEAWHERLNFQGQDIGPTGGVHQKLINRLRNPDPKISDVEKKISRLLAAKLEVMRARRNKSDYSLSEIINAPDGQIHIEQVESLLDKTNPNRAIK